MRNRYFSSQPDTQRAAAELYASAKDLPLVCPHGHVDPRLFADPDYQFGSPVDLLIIPDHYIFRMLYSQGIALGRLGIPTLDSAPIESDHRVIWQLVCDHWHLFRATPTGIWIRDALADVFGITLKLNSANAMTIYDQIAAQLASPAFRPRALYERFNIEVLATTDAATDSLQQHIAIRESGWDGRIIPTFRPDAVVNIDADWRDNIERLGEAAGRTVHDYASYIQALEDRRAFFQSLGATATDHAALSAYTEALPAHSAETIFQRALKGAESSDDARRFTGHMLLEMARMSSEDGLVMQLHIGSWRNHNPAVYARHGRDMGADMPTSSEFTRNLKPLLDRFGNHGKLRLALFNLDETTLSRELAPLAGHYPILRLGPPWWFYDSWLGIMRFLDAVVETAGIYNLAGFNDDTRAYPSIPTRHDVWRRACAQWLAEQLLRGFIDDEDAYDMMRALAYDLAKETYSL
ncbi:MAG: glucuronate isomerase [Chloroflexi bacterium]|nr:glucuronate isomerase [Chloroflexota bacterium]MYC55719.1 glucuronate isomerase [Chloroflexota bacterium]